MLSCGMSWSDKFRGAVTAVKDTGASAAIQHWLKAEMADYGEVLDFTFSSRNRSAEVHVLLKGEHDRLTVYVDEYEITRSNEGDFIVVKKARASREWVNAVLRNFVIDKPHRIPEQYAGLVKMVLGS
jgi:hypothetical protein